ncbi:hypothetical protein CBM2637_A100043 [Cupriavidus taiwanensis]|nr:hypothetical protein CBM2637_A100043 [Cupriavidus taiwanensis]
MFLDRVDGAGAWLNAFDRGDPAVVGFGRPHQATVHRLAIHKDHARSTLPHVAGAGQAGVVAQRVQQCAVRLDGQLAQFFQLTPAAEGETRAFGPAYGVEQAFSSLYDSACHTPRLLEDVFCVMGPGRHL